MPETVKYPELDEALRHRHGLEEYKVWAPSSRYGGNVAYQAGPWAKSWMWHVFYWKWLRKYVILHRDELYPCLNRPETNNHPHGHLAQGNAGIYCLLTWKQIRAMKPEIFSLPLTTAPPSPT